MTHPEEVTRLAAPDCRHSVIRTYSAADPAIPPLWACESCNRRFYPACPTCVSVGHRGECAAEVRVQPEPPITEATVREAWRRLDAVGDPKTPHSLWKQIENVAGVQPEPEAGDLDVERLDVALTTAFDLASEALGELPSAAAGEPGAARRLLAIAIAREYAAALQPITEADTPEASRGE